MPDYLPANEFELLQFLTNFNTVAAANLATLGFTAGEVAASTTATATYGTDLGDSVAKQDAAKASVATKNNSKGSAVNVVRNLARRVQANLSVPDGLKVTLGLPVYNTPPTPILPQQPTFLVANGSESGTNTLRWKRNGNKTGTTFIIEARVDDTGDFKFVDTTQKASYDHRGQMPGRKIAYRVKAKRPAGESDYSNVAVVYDLVLPLAA